MRRESPRIVQVCDQIRCELETSGEYDEFCWFAREYPRCYRFHFDAAEFRLKSLRKLMEGIGCQVLVGGPDMPPTPEPFWYGFSNMEAYRVYWDFESFLSEVNIALNLAARVVGPAFRNESPPSFNRFCSMKTEHALVDLFRAAKRCWVQRLKDYRDCFTHYTPVDTMVSVTVSKSASGYRVGAKLPTNPNVREILGFRYSKRVELYRYSIGVYRHLVAFDKAVAATLRSLYGRGEFPIRKDHLFFVGRRDTGDSRKPAKPTNKAVTIGANVSGLQLASAGNVCS